MTRIKQLAVATAALATLCSAAAFASSHREAPFTATNPTIDGTDFYMFKDYSAGPKSPDNVVLIANYNPLQDPYGGPNYFSLNPNALYAINIDNNGSAKAAISFQFKFTNVYKATALPTGKDASGNPVNIAIPLVVSGPVKNTGDNAGDANVNAYETYTVTMIKDGTSTPLTTSAGDKTFQKPLDNIGSKTFPNGYAAYADADSFINKGVSFGSCGTGTIFVGQRRDGFIVNLGEIFDLVNYDPLGGRDSGQNLLAGKNITSLVMSVPTACLTKDGKGITADAATTTADPVLGGWTTSYLRQARVLNPVPNGTNNAEVSGGAYSQVSRLGAPLVNELVIGLPDKDRFNASQPKDDTQFLSYVTNPSLPVLINALFKAPAPTTPRDDLVGAFLTGLTLKATKSATPDKVVFSNNPGDFGDAVQPSEQLRLNTAVAAVAAAGQNNLGLLACDVAGFPNGRRPADDVVDIELTAAEGAITADNTNKLQTCDVSSGTPTVVNPGAVVNDGAEAAATDTAYYLTEFPYLQTPVPGSTNKERAAAANVTTGTGTAAGGDTR